MALTAPAQSVADDGQLQKLKAKTDPYLERVERQPDWLVSRLQMYWSTHATEVYIKGETFDHPGGPRAAAPTVKYNGTRSHASDYRRPKLEDIIPYDDDADGSVHFLHPQTGQKEKVHPSKTGCNIASINRQIATIARDAARLYAATRDERYARMAYGVFDVYLKGIYYRQVPVDLNHGHQQTLVGMQTFEVIHEDVVNELTDIYRLLGDYVRQDRDLYDAALKKWADNIIAGGVPHNNWNLFQAMFIAKIALALQPDAAYADGKGREHYLSHITEKSSIRQWSIPRMAAFGFDEETAIWYESPGYSVTVLGDFSQFANEMDRDCGVDFFRDIPVLLRAIETAAQYLMPNRMIAGFGDTHPHYLKTKAIDNVLDYARRHADGELTARFERLRAAVAPTASVAEVTPYVSPSFYAPGVSWLMQRSGMDARHDLAISLNGSLGNHQHANGISMELYGKGFVLGPDAGIGAALYSGLDYQEYYSQFPAHNTVCVNGVSAYPVMMSHHAFRVEARYPETNATGGFGPVTFSQVSFTEPETQARQLRTNGIVKTGETGGYYVDIFRSQTTGDRQFHDYFYHNLGQTMRLTAADGADLNLQPTEELAFAGGHLGAYSYIYNKVAATTDRPVRSTFTIDGGPEMTLWFKGGEGQTVFQALSPVNMEYERLGKFMPYEVAKQPVLTFVARRQGEAWTHPFVAVYEPSTQEEPAEIAAVDYFTPAPGAVGIVVRLKSGTVDYVFSAPEPCKMSYKGITVRGVYAVVRNGKILLEK